MQLNTLKPAENSRKAAKRVGRGTGSGTGKTCGRGHKGQKSRSGGFHKSGFEGGQMPIHRRLPKIGFSARTGRFSAQVRLNELALIEADVIDLEALKAAKIISSRAKRAKVFASGEINKAVTLRGISVSSGAKAAIEAAGGKVEA